MTRVRIAELKDRLSAHLRAVEKGAQIEVADRERVIARIVPAHRGPGTIEIVRAARPFATVRSRRFAAARWPVDSLDLLLEERGDR